MAERTVVGLAERRRQATAGGEIVWHCASAAGNDRWRPILCGQDAGEGILLPGNSVTREPTCPDCIALLAAATH